MPDQSQDAFARLVDRLGEAAGVVDSPAGPADPLTTVEGYRHLLRLVSAGVDLLVERADADRPELTVWMSPTRKFLGDNPDTIYTTAPVDDSRRYRLRIAGGNAFYRGVVVYGRGPSGSVRIVSNIHDTDMAPDADGALTLILSSERPDDRSNWSPLDDDAYQLMVREYFVDHSDKQGADLTIDALGPEPGTAVLDDAGLAAGIDELASWIHNQTRADDLLTAMQIDHPNAPAPPAAPEVPPELISVFLPTPDIHYAGCAFDLDDDRALVISGRPPPGRYWSINLMNHWWESFDYRERKAGINNFDVDLDADGSFSIVVAHRDPGRSNWIPLHGHRRGLVAFRTLLPDGEPEPATFDVIELA